MSHENKPLTSKMCGFALNLDLTVYFEDLRKYSSVYVDLSKFKKVSDVEKHIKSIFKLEDNLCLTNKKFLIPSCEDIQILQQFETLKVQKCDFFDQQIHKNKRSNPDCDQTALNLIQTERSIDLSCRPKQRLKLCRNHSFSGISLTPFVENAKIQSIPRPSTSSNSVFDEPCQKNKEKQRNKSKGRDFSSDENGMKNNVENSVDILDMSVNKPMKNNYKNCFSVDEGFGIEPCSKLYKKSNNSKNPLEISLENTVEEPHRKSKKRKKHSKAIQEYMDSYSSQWETLPSDNGSNPSETVKRHKKKSKVSSIEVNATVTDLAEDENVFRDEDNNDLIHNSTASDDIFLRKKHKKKRKLAELTENLDNAYAQCNGKAQVLERNTDSYMMLCERSDLKNSHKHTTKKNLEERKEILLKKCDELSQLAGSEGYLLDPNRFSSANEELEDSSVKSNKIKASDIGGNKNSNINKIKSEKKEEENTFNTIVYKDNVFRKYLRKCKETQRNAEDFSSNINCGKVETNSEIVNESERKPCQKSFIKFISKKDSNEAKIVDNQQVTGSYKLPVESDSSASSNDTVDNSCNTSFAKVESINESNIFTKESSEGEKNVYAHSDSLEIKTRRKRIRRHNKRKKRERKVLLSAVGPVLNKITSEIQVKPPQSLSEEGKHIFFGDNSPEIVTSSAPPVVQDTSVDVYTSSTEVTTTGQYTECKSNMWQEELLKLVCNSGKPVVFHRSNHITSEKAKFPSESSQTLSPGVNNSADPHLESVAKVHDSKSVSVDTVLERTCEFSENSNICNGETKTANVSEACSGTEHNYSGIKKLPEAVKSIPNDIQNIILTNYPIIDKVVAEDLILFKVLKLNGNNQPDMSQTILAKVNDSSIFPEKICLQILEGCEECGMCKKINESGKELLIELRWTEILEPRLFYP